MKQCHSQSPQMEGEVETQSQPRKKSEWGIKSGGKKILEMPEKEKKVQEERRLELRSRCFLETLARGDQHSQIGQCLLGNGNSLPSTIWCHGASECDRGQLFLLESKSTSRPGMDAPEQQTLGPMALLVISFSLLLEAVEVNKKAFILQAPSRFPSVCALLGRPEICALKLFWRRAHT